jgi:hypothetical protein
MTRLGGAKPPIAVVPAPEPAKPAAPIVPTAASLRTRMAQAIVDFEARRDKAGHIMVYHPPANDGGGAYEVAGLNETYDKPIADKVIALLKAGKYDQAETRAVEAIAANTDFAAKITSIPCLESYLRDCIFNRGQSGAIKILQIALGFQGSKNNPREVDGKWGSKTKAAVRAAEQDPHGLLGKFRPARERYERDFTKAGYRANVWPGLVNRWDGAAKVALTFPDEPVASPTPKAIAALVTTAAAGGGAGVAAYGADFEWWHIALIVTGFALTALAGWFLFKKQVR